jgi:hypothetical protein
MTTDDWWAEIERYTLAGDRNGLLVCADGLQEMGDPEAESVRWVANRWKPYRVRHRSFYCAVEIKYHKTGNSYVWGLYVTDLHVRHYRTLKEAFRDVKEYREEWVRFYTSTTL